MPDPFTIRIFVPDGDPEGVRIILPLLPAGSEPQSPLAPGGAPLP